MILSERDGETKPSYLCYMGGGIREIITRQTFSILKINFNCLIELVCKANPNNKILWTTFLYDVSHDRVDFLNIIMHHTGKGNINNRSKERHMVCLETAHCSSRNDISGEAYTAGLTDISHSTELL